MQMTTTTTMSDSAETPLQPAPSGKLSRNFRQTSAKLAEIWWVFQGNCNEINAPHAPSPGSEKSCPAIVARRDRCACDHRHGGNSRPQPGARKAQ
jgi:hypothetical protein